MHAYAGSALFVPGLVTHAPHGAILSGTLTLPDICTYCLELYTGVDVASIAALLQTALDGHVLAGVEQHRQVWLRLIVAEAALLRHRLNW